MALERELQPYCRGAFESPTQHCAVSNALYPNSWMQGVRPGTKGTASRSGFIYQHGS